MSSLVLQTAPLFLFDKDNVIFFCGDDGIYNSPSPAATMCKDEDDFDDVIMASDDDEDLFSICSPAKKPRRECEKDATKVYKFKHGAVSFSKCGDVLFSLHRRKNENTYHVECTKINDFTCANGCLVKLDGVKQSATFSPWLHAVPFKDLVTESGNAAAGGKVAHVTLFVNVSGEICNRLELSCAGDQVISRNLAQAVRTVNDIYLNCYRPSNKGSEDDVIDAILRRQKLDLKNTTCCFVMGDIDRLHPFRDGFLVQTKSGKVWQYSKDGTELVKSLLPNKKVRLLSVSEEGETKASVLIRSGAVYSVELPYRKENPDLRQVVGRVGETEKLTRSEMVSEIVDCAFGLKKLNKVRIQQREILAQLKIVTFLKGEKSQLPLDCDCCVSTYSSLGLRATHELSLRVTNRTKFALSGQFWKLIVKIGSDRFLVETVALPETLSPEEEFVARVKLLDEFCALASLPLAIEADLCFNYLNRSRNVIWKEAVMKSEVNATDFVRLLGKQEKHDKRVSSPSAKEDCFEEFVSGLAATKSGEGETDSGHSEKVFSFPFPFTLPFLQHYSRKQFFGQLQDVLLSSDNGTSKQTLKLALFVSEITANASESVEGCHLVSISSRDREVLLTLKRDLLSLLCDFISRRNGPESVSRTVITKADIIREEVGLIGQKETGENMALFEKYFRRFRLQVSAKLV
jgi:hypothetical protein